MSRNLQIEGEEKDQQINQMAIEIDRLQQILKEIDEAPRDDKSENL
jgi:hypothetical protein